MLTINAGILRKEGLSIKHGFGNRHCKLDEKGDNLDTIVNYTVFIK